MDTENFKIKPLLMSRIIFTLGMIGIAIGAIGVHTTTNPSLIKFFDNLHWTSGTVAAALIVGVGLFQVDSGLSKKSRQWFFLGFSGYALGQIIWDIQTAVAYGAFPSPSDLFYLWLGPCLSIALFYEMQAKEKGYNRFAYWLDLLALAVAALTLILISYLPRKGELDTLSISVLVAYPVTLIIPVLMLLLMIPTMRLMLDAKLVLFLVASSVTAWSWMHWNSMALDGTTIDGSWFNVSFSASILILGLVIFDWRLKFIDNALYDRVSEAFLRFLPIITVLLSSAAIVTINSNPPLNKLIEDLVYAGAAVVIVLAIIRQSRLLQERDRLLKVQQEALRSATIIKTIIQTAPVRIFWKDRNLNYLGSNDLFARDAGFEHYEQLIGKSDFDMGWKEQAELYRSDDLRVMESGKAVVGYEEPQTTPDGSQIWLRTSKAPLVDEASGETIGILGVYDDISQIKAIQLKLKELNENLEQQVESEISKRLEKERLLVQQARLASMGEMINNIAHQWRQPLNALAINIQDIPVAVQCGQMNKEYADNFRQESMRLIKYMSETIEDFRNFFKPDKQKVEFDIRENIEHVLLLIKDVLKSSYIDVKVNASDEAMKFFGYPNEFSQALLNILGNAKDALIEHKDDSDRRINIVAEKNNNVIIVSISDNAGGISQGIIDKIFDPYFTTKHSSQGTGLGLYMSKMIIEQNMSGKLSVHNENAGACFVIELYS